MLIVNILCREVFYCANERLICADTHVLVTSSTFYIFFYYPLPLAEAISLSSLYMLSFQLERETQLYKYFCVLGSINNLSYSLILGEYQLGLYCSEFFWERFMVEIIID